MQKEIASLVYLGQFMGLKISNLTSQSFNFTSQLRTIIPTSQGVIRTKFNKICEKGKTCKTTAMISDKETETQES